MGLDPLCHLLAALSSREKALRAAVNTRSPWRWPELKTVKCSGWFVRQYSAPAPTPTPTCIARLCAHVLHGTRWINPIGESAFAVCGAWKRVQARKAGFPLRKRCSSPLSVNTGKEMLKKCPRLTISTVNTYCTALCSVPLGQHVDFMHASVSVQIQGSGNSFTSSKSECSIHFYSLWSVLYQLLSLKVEQ